MVKKVLLDESMFALFSRRARNRHLSLCPILFCFFLFVNLMFQSPFFHSLVRPLSPGAFFCRVTFPRRGSSWNASFVSLRSIETCSFLHFELFSLFLSYSSISFAFTLAFFMVGMAAPCQLSSRHARAGNSRSPLHNGHLALSVGPIQTGAPPSSYEKP